MPLVYGWGCAWVGAFSGVGFSWIALGGVVGLGASAGCGPDPRTPDAGLNV